jgi:hypothetical protein
MAVTVGARRGEAPSGLLAVGEEVTYMHNCITAYFSFLEACNSKNYYW